MHGEQLTEELLIKIEEAVANGANTNKEVAVALRWTEEKFRNWKHGVRKNGAEEKAQIATAIKKGTARQKGSMLRLAETAMAISLQERHITETKTEVTVQKSKEGDEGEVIYEKTTTTHKYIAPNPTLSMFTAVNCSSGKWKSINNVQNITVKEKSKYEVELGD